MSTITTFYVGGTPVPGPAGTVLAGAMYVERHTSDEPRHATPVVLVHGGGGRGSEWLATPDGRPGWAPLLVEAGYTVYVVDRPAHARSPYHPSMGPVGPALGDEVLTMLFRPPALGPGAHPTAYRHTRWPGTREPDDPALAFLNAGGFGTLVDVAGAQDREGDLLAMLLDRIGPAVVVAHSNGGPGAWLAADRCPDKVAAFVALEVLGPPFVDEPEVGRALPWGLTTAPLTYAPAVTDPAELRVRIDPSPENGPVPLLLPSAGHRLPNLARFPIAVVTAEASLFRMFDRHLVRFLTETGCRAELVRLEDHGVHGHSHGLIWELGNDEALAVVTDWIAKQLTLDGG